MDISLKGRDLLTLADLTPAELAAVLDTADVQKRAWAQGVRDLPLAGKSVALVFQKPSVRTRVSFEVACARLGMHPVTLSGPDGAFSRGETVGDTAHVLERYCDAIVIRTASQLLLEELADTADVPVINALTDEHHPCQGLADLLTIREKLDRLAGVKIAYVGDGNNMANTYLLAGALTGMSVAVATPDGYDPPASVVADARAIASTTNATIDVSNDPESVVNNADVVVTDTWASMGWEDEHAERVSAFASYRVDEALMTRAADGAIFMHCLPAHRGEEVVDEVMDAPYSVVFDQAENRLHVQKALLSMVLG